MQEHRDRHEAEGGRKLALERHAKVPSTEQRAAERAADGIHREEQSRERRQREPRRVGRITNFQ